MWQKIVALLTILACFNTTSSYFFECHDDPAYEPRDSLVKDLQFTWFGILQYVHVKTGAPHTFRAPRVVLLTRHYVLSTASDAFYLPYDHVLGNIIFTEYERDETECSLPADQQSDQEDCEAVLLIVPIIDVLFFPEAKAMKYRNSMALLKLLQPIKSAYVLPACFPFSNYMVMDPLPPLYLVDFDSEFPVDEIVEQKYITGITLLPSELCFIYENEVNSSSSIRNHVCSTTCGVHSGAPVMVHEHTGQWTVVAITEGNSQCPDPLRIQRTPAPPQHTMIFKYVPWIVAVITGDVIGTFPKDDPFGKTISRTSAVDVAQNAWVGRWWLGGIRCYDRGEPAEDMFRFYHELLQVKPRQHEGRIKYFIEINSLEGTAVVCVKVAMPFRGENPKVWGLDTDTIKLMLPVLEFRRRYVIQIEAWAVNGSGVRCPD